MIDGYEIAKNIENLLSGIHGIKSCSLGLEKGINAKDAPLIRIVPVGDKRVSNNRVEITFDIFLITDTKEDYDELYRLHYDYINEIRALLHLTQIENGVLFDVGLQMDSDTVKNLKISVLTFELRGLTDD